MGLTNTQRYVVVAAFVVGILAGGGVHHGCVNPPPPVSLPDPGTPRAAFCATADTGQPWSQALLTMALAAVLLLLVRNTRVRGAGLVALVAANIALVVLATNLTAALTI